MLERIKENIQVISTIVQAVMIIILVGVTLWYAVSTKTMTNIMSEEFKLSNRPYVSMASYRWKEKDEGEYLLQAILKNHGKIPAIIFYSESKSDILMSAPANMNFLLYPGVDTYHEILTISELPDNPTEEYVKYKIKYRTAGEKTNDNYCIEYSLMFKTDDLDNLRIDESVLCE